MKFILEKVVAVLAMSSYLKDMEKKVPKVKSEK